MEIKMLKKEEAGTLMKRTQELLKKADPIQVSANTKLNFYWILKFGKGEVPDPSVNKVQRLYEYLANTTLKV